MRSERGLRSHVSQTPFCRERMEAAFPPMMNRSKKHDKNYQTDSGSDIHMQSDTNSPDISSDELDEMHLDADPPIPEQAPPPLPQPPVVPPNPRQTTLEEIVDEDAPDAPRWFEDYPFPAGSIIEQVDPVYTKFESIRQKQKMADEAPWAPFESEDEWELARWLMESGISQKKTDSFLKLPTVCIYYYAPLMSNVQSFTPLLDFERSQAIIPQ